MPPHAAGPDTDPNKPVWCSQAVTTCMSAGLPASILQPFTLHPSTISLQRRSSTHHYPPPSSLATENPRLRAVGVSKRSLRGSDRTELASSTPRLLRRRQEASRAGSLMPHLEQMARNPSENYVTEETSSAPVMKHMPE